MDTVRLLSSADSARISLQGISLSVVKALTENTETCLPASQTPNPIVKVTTIAFSHHTTTKTIQVIRSSSNPEAK